MKEFVIKTICFITGADWKIFFLERWDLSEVFVWKEYGGNGGLVLFLKDYRSVIFSNGIDVRFYDSTFKVKSIVGYTRSGVCSIAVNKRAFAWSTKQ